MAKGYDCQVTVVLTMVVRTDDGEHAARKIADAFAEQMLGATDCEDGETYGFPAVTEFSMSTGGEACVDCFDETGEGA